jgi:hypothetical protein
MEAGLRTFLTLSLDEVNGRFQAPEVPSILQPGGGLGVTTERKMCRQILMLIRHALLTNTKRKTARFCNGKKYI